MVEERDAGVDAHVAAAVEVEFDDDVGLFGLAFDPRAAGGGGSRVSQGGHCAPSG